MEIDIKNIKAAYRTATESERTLLFTLFPDLHLGEEEKDNRPITERVKTFEDACRELGEDHPMVIEYRATNGGASDVDHVLSNDLLAFLKLRIITAALNEGWQPQFTEDEWRWCPWFNLWKEEDLSEKDDDWKACHALILTEDYSGSSAGFAFAYSDSAPSYADVIVGSRLCFKSEALATYCGKQFISLWAEFNFFKKQEA